MDQGTQTTGHYLTNEAYQYYTGKHDNRWPFRCYLPQSVLQKMSDILDRRPLTLEELRLLVGEDGEPTTCSAIGETFQPVWWRGIVSISQIDMQPHLNPIFAEELEASVSVEEALENACRLTFGCFYVVEDKVCAFSGSTVYFNPRSGRYYITDQDRSPLAAMRMRHPEKHWGMTREEASRVVAQLKQEKKEESERQKRVEDRRRLLDEMASQVYIPKKQRRDRTGGRGCVPANLK